MFSDIHLTILATLSVCYVLNSYQEQEVILTGVTDPNRKHTSDKVV